MRTGVPVTMKPPPTRARAGGANRDQLRTGTITRSLTVLLLLTGMIAGCSSAPSEPASADVTVRLFVDSNGNRTWDEGETPLPDVAVFLDGDWSEVTDPEGVAVFEAVSGSGHAISVDEGVVEELASHSVICGNPSQTIDLDEGGEVLFCFNAVGFLDVDVAEEEGED